MNCTCGCSCGPNTCHGSWTNLWLFLIYVSVAVGAHKIGVIKNLLDAILEAQ